MGLLDGIIGPIVTNVLGVLDVPVVLSRPGRNYNPRTGEAAVAAATWTVKASPPAGVAQLFTDSAGVSMIKKTGMAFLLAQVGVNNATQVTEPITPGTEDSILFNGKTFRISAVNPTYSGSEVAVWKVEVGK